MIQVVSSNFEKQIIGLILPANSLVVGSVIEIKAVGIINTASVAPTATWNIRFGEVSLFNVILATVTPTVDKSLTGKMWMIHALINAFSVGQFGILVCNGIITGEYSTFLNQAIKGIPVRSQNMLDTTVDNIVELTFKFGIGTSSVSNQLLCSNALIISQ